MLREVCESATTQKMGLNAGNGSAIRHFGHHARWRLIERITASPLFQKSARLRDLLRFMPERPIHSQLQDLTPPTVFLRRAQIARPFSHSFNSPSLKNRAAASTAPARSAAPSCALARTSSRAAGV